MQGRSYRHLNAEEREEVSRGVAAGLSMRELARALGRSPSTLSREVWRNGPGGSYRVLRAVRLARERTCRPHRRRRLSDPRLRRYVYRKLLCGWSPEQIMLRLRRDFPLDRTRWVSHETIYAALYVMPRGKLKQALRRGRTQRKHRRKTEERRGRIPNMVSIHDRPAEVADRRVPGHWEGDLIQSGRTKPAVGVLVERTSRLVLLVKLEASTAEAAEAGFTRKLKRVPTILRKSLTYDQGKEMSNHESLAKRVQIRIFFADPRSPWQRATCENTNGLIRQYFPKSTDFTHVTQQQLNGVAQRLNTRPRKGLDAATPLEVFEELITK